MDDGIDHGVALEVPRHSLQLARIGPTRKCQRGRRPTNVAPERRAPRSAAVRRQRIRTLTARAPSAARWSLQRSVRVIQMPPACSQSCWYFGQSSIRMSPG